MFRGCSAELLARNSLATSTAVRRIGICVRVLTVLCCCCCCCAPADVLEVLAKSPPLAGTSQSCQLMAQRPSICRQTMAAMIPCTLFSYTPEARKAGTRSSAQQHNGCSSSRAAGSRASSSIVVMRVRVGSSGSRLGSVVVVLHAMSLHGSMAHTSCMTGSRPTTSAWCAPSGCTRSG